MFDNPRKALHRIEQELLAAEQPQEAEAFPNGTIESADCLEEAQWIQRTGPMLEQSGEETEVSRKKGVSHQTTASRYAQDTLENDRVLLVEKRKRKRKAGKKKPRGCLPLVLLVETAIIAAMIWWGIQWVK